MSIFYTKNMNKLYTKQQNHYIFEKRDVFYLKERRMKG